MSPPPAKLDIAAAEQLSQRLSQLAERLEWLVWLRTSQRSTWLGEATSDNWSGRKRNDFEQKYAAEQARLKALAAEALRLKSTVDQAINAARYANMTTHQEPFDLRRPSGAGA